MYIVKVSKHQRARRRITLGASCGGPGVATQIAEKGAMTGAAAAVSFIPVVGPFLAPFTFLLGALFGPSLHAKCAHGQPTAEAYLQCAKKKPVDNFVVIWDPAKCGWYKWVWCCGARNNLAPPSGCGPCNPAKVGKGGCAQGSVIISSGPGCTKEVSAALAAGQSIAGATGTTTNIAGVPWWVFALGGGAVLLVTVL